MKIGAGDLPARPWKFNRCKSRLVLDKGTWNARVQNLGQGARLQTSVGQFSNEKALQSFFDDGFFIRELAVLDPPSKKPLKIVCESDVNHKVIPCWLMRAPTRRRSVASEAVRWLFLDDDTRHGVLDHGGCLKDLLQVNTVIAFSGAVFDKLVVDEVIERWPGLLDLILRPNMGRPGSDDPAYPKWPGPGKSGVVSETTIMRVALPGAKPPERPTHRDSARKQR